MFEWIEKNELPVLDNESFKGWDTSQMTDIKGMFVNNRKTIISGYKENKNMFEVIAICTKCKSVYSALESKSTKECICENCKNFFFELKIVETRFISLI